MCRCCQSCLEDIYWNCIEEKFCFDESIANYNPDEDNIVTKDSTQIINGIGNGRQSIDNNNMPICTQPLHRNNSLLNSKMHEEDYRREIQTSVPILAPEILAVFANSQIFQEHQAKGLARSNTKSLLPGIHSATIKDKLENDQEKLLFHLEGSHQTNNKNDIAGATVENVHSEKRIKFTLADSSPLEINSTSSPHSSKQKFPIIEENNDEDNINITSDSIPITIKKKNSNSSNSLPSSVATTNPVLHDKNEVILRPRIRNDDDDPINILKKNAIERNHLRHMHSLPYFSVRPVASENDIFSISLARSVRSGDGGSGGGGSVAAVNSNSFGQLSMTPDVPSISYSALPKNYEDTPTIEKYKESVSLFSIQAANQAEANNRVVDYSMPRYFRMTMTKSVENVTIPTALSISTTGSVTTIPSGTKSNYSSRDNINQNIKRHEKSRRLKNLRDSLPPLLIHAVRKKDDSKQVN